MRVRRDNEASARYRRISAFVKICRGATTRVKSLGVEYRDSRDFFPIITLDEFCLCAMDKLGTVCTPKETTPVTLQNSGPVDEFHADSESNEHTLT